MCAQCASPGSQQLEARKLLHQKGDRELVLMVFTGVGKVRKAQVPPAMDAGRLPECQLGSHGQVLTLPRVPSEGCVPKAKPWGAGGA